MLTREAILRELIKYDSEHPATLGEMADRREVYAKRLEALSVNADIVVRKYTEVLGDGVNSDYVMSNPFHSREVIAHAYLTETNDFLINMPDVSQEHIRWSFGRPLKTGEVTVVIQG